MTVMLLILSRWRFIVFLYGHAGDDAVGDRIVSWNIVKFVQQCVWHRFVLKWEEIGLGGAFNAGVCNKENNFFHQIQKIG